VFRLFGLDQDSGRRRLVEDVLRKALAGEQASIEIAEDAVEGGDATSSPSRSSPSSRMRILELSAYPVISPGGEPVGFLHSVDATERRNLAMRSAQSERMESLGALAGGLAHDFNNLLFVTLGNLQLMAMNESVVRDEKLSKFVSRSMSAVERGAEITKSLLAVARSQPLEESPVTLAELVKGILPLVRQALGAGRRVEVDIADPALQLRLDSGRLSSCILNLAFNARDAMGPNGTLSISAKLDEDSDMVELSIADDGAGMPPEVVARAFEPFFTTKSPGSGTGLGLATVYAFAKQSGGTAYLESRIGSGTKVSMVLPRYTGVVTPAEVVSARRSGRRVVVADDEQDLAEMVAAWLIDMGIDARFATSPKAALELIESFEPDVLVSDANFGEELDGIELARLGTAIVPEMAVVFMTGYSTSMRELQELGERTLAKPFSREDLYSALSPLIAEESADAGDRATKPTRHRKKDRS
jgi:signal transduction histidine kinase/CheY-like chemotaxis protein